MTQGLLDMFAAAGFAFTRFFLLGLHSHTTWFWLVLAAGGLVWSMYLGALEAGGIEIIVKQAAAVLLSAFLLYAYKSVDLADYTYSYPGKLEQEIGTTKGGAPLPTYLIYITGRFFAVDVRGVISSGRTLSIPDIGGEVDLMTADPEVLKDSQLRANYSIWNQIVAPYLLKSDPVLSRSLEAENLLGEFMNPVPNDAGYVGGLAAKSARVQQLLAASTVSLGDMECTLQSMIDTVASRENATSWTSESGSCTSPTIKLTFVGRERAPELPGLFTSLGSREAYSIGTDVANQMMRTSGVSTEVATIGSFSQLYDKLGRSVLFVAGNRYATDAKKLILLGTQCDKISQRSCELAQAGLFRAVKRVTSNVGLMDPIEKTGLLGKVGKGFADLGAFFITSVFTAVMWVLSILVKSFMPYAMGAAIMMSVVASVVGIYMLLIPKRFGVAMEWMLGPITWANTWVAMFSIWIEVDTWITKISSLLASTFSLDSAFSRNACSIVVSLGYLVLPFLAWNLIFGTAARAVAKAGGLSTRAIEGGIALAFLGATKGPAGLRKFMGGDGKSTQSGGNGGGGGGGGSGNGAGSSAPPSSAVPPESSSPQNDNRPQHQPATSDDGTARPASNLPPSAGAGGGGMIDTTTTIEQAKAERDGGKGGNGGTTPGGNSIPEFSFEAKR